MAIFVYDFPTAWAPPTYWLEKVAADYPKLSFHLAYCEEGIGFAGETLFENGSLTYCSECNDDNWHKVVKQLGFDIESEEQFD